MKNEPRLFRRRDHKKRQGLGMSNLKQHLVCFNVEQKNRNTPLKMQMNNLLEMSVTWRSATIKVTTHLRQREGRCLSPWRRLAILTCRDLVPISAFLQDLNRAWRVSQELTLGRTALPVDTKRSAMSRADGPAFYISWWCKDVPSRQYQVSLIFNSSYGKSRLLPGDISITADWLYQFNRLCPVFCIEAALATNNSKKETSAALHNNNRLQNSLSQKKRCQFRAGKCNNILR